MRKEATVMPYIKLNLNPQGLSNDDCVVRAISLLLSKNWYETHYELCSLSRFMADMPNSNRVWKEYLKNAGYSEELILNTCPRCYTVKQFCVQHPNGRYLLSTTEYTLTSKIIVTGSHVVTVIDGDYYDTWDSGDDIPLSYFYRRDLR